MTQRHCKLCGKAIRYYPRTFSWRHLSRDVDHAPVPA